VRLLRGLLAEVQTNIEIRPWDIASPMRADYVLDVWAGARDQLGELPDEVLDAARLGYAMAARYSSLAAWERRWGFESEGAVVSIKKVCADKWKTRAEMPTPPSRKLFRFSSIGF
jgi:hypothetical protein